jgi:hypothetical protein
MTLHFMPMIEKHSQANESARLILPLSTWPCVVIMRMLMLSQTEFEFILNFAQLNVEGFLISKHRSRSEDNSLALRPVGYQRGHRVALENLIGTTHRCIELHGLF